MTKKVIFFNGPPRCGKDTSVNRLVKLYMDAEHIKFSDPMKEALPVFFGLSKNETYMIENKKEEKLEELLGMSWREVQISLSETWAKPTFSKEVFGKIALNKIKKSNSSLFFISDSGFVEEAATIINSIGENNCLLIRLYREGCDFSKDSRSYWEHPFKNITEIIIHNNSDIRSLVQECMLKIDGWMQNDNI